MDKISIVVPCFNEEKSLPYFNEQILKVIAKMKYCTFEVIFIDDGSSDDTFNLIKKYSVENQIFKYVSFSRNFGKEAAMYAGFKEATGDFIVVMDVDLQDPPELLEKMYKAVKEEGYDCAAARRANRKGEPILRSFFSHVFYKLINKLSNVQIVEGARDFRLMSRQMLNSVLEVSEYNRFSKGIFSFVGYKTKWISYQNVKRVAGSTKWSFFKLLSYSLEGITAFSTTPLVISSIVGIVFCLISLVAIIFIILKTIVFGDPTSGWPSLACIIIFVSGVQLLSLGIIGQYLSRTYLEVKKRPIYIIKQKNTSNQNDEDN